ncbi:MAG TPA: acyltransferase family protein [Marmoricola sp.]|jgi:fucose 4-O-acetylase-like acetyltransferase|nr:acyltransferase family protein [Marmoricola sp.]
MAESLETVASAPAPAPALQPAPKQRDPWFDNIKMTLVTLVVVGHSWTMLPDSLAKGWLYDFLYAWHVPAFVVITGYLSKSFRWTPEKLWSLVKTVAVPYVVFEAALAAFRHQFLGVRFDDLFTDPHWPMWYLSALFFWRLMTPIFLRLPAKVAIATLISLAAGLWAGDIFDMARIFGLLPFFVLGLKMHEGHWNLLRAKAARYYAVAGLLAIFALSRFTNSWIETEWLYYRSRYDVLDPDDLRAALIRMVLILVGLVGAYAVFALIPRTKGWFTTMGAATLVVYLFHGFPILTARALGYPGWAADHLWLALPITTVAALVVALALAWPPVSRRLKVVVDPIGAWERWVRRRRGQDPTSA